MPERMVALKVGTVLCAGLLAAASGYAGAQTAQPALPVVSTVSGTAPSLAGQRSAAQPTSPTAIPTTAAPVTVAAIPTTTTTTRRTAVTTTASRAAPAVATSPAVLTPTAQPAATGALAAATLPVTAVKGHGVTGTVIRRQGAFYIVRPSVGPDVRVHVDRETQIRSQSAGTARLPRPGDRTVAVGAPRADGALAARAMLLSPAVSAPALNQSPRRR